MNDAMRSNCSALDNIINRNGYQLLHIKLHAKLMCQKINVTVYPNTTFMCLRFEDNGVFTFGLKVT